MVGAHLWEICSDVGTSELFGKWQGVRSVQMPVVFGRSPHNQVQQNGSSC